MEQTLPTKTPFPTQEVEGMYNTLRRWAIAFPVLGGIALVSGLLLGREWDVLWFICLCVAALLTLKLRIPEILAVFAVLLAWAAVINLLAIFTAKQGYVLTTIIAQGYLLYLIFRQLWSYRHLHLQELYRSGGWPTNLAPPRDEALCCGRLALASAAIGGVILVLAPLSCAGIFLLSAFNPQPATAELAELLVSGVSDLAALALGLGVAALLAKNAYRGAAIAGVVINAVALSGLVGLALVGMLMP